MPVTDDVDMVDRIVESGDDPGSKPPEPGDEMGSGAEGGEKSATSESTGEEREEKHDVGVSRQSTTAHVTTLGQGVIVVSGDA